MRAKAQRWGNSLAVRIPKPVAEALRIEPETELDLSVEEGSLRITPLRGPRYSLHDLLDDVTEENVPTEEWDTGPAVGREVW